MKFNRIIGKIDTKLIVKAQDMLSKVFLELALKYSNEHVGSGLGGDPLLFTLLQPMQHIATLNIPTAATDGKRYYWNPEFVLSKSPIGLRLVCGHEAWHAIYMHPQRRGSRNPKLWNIAVDYIVNGTVMDDLKNRKRDPGKFFKEHLGNFITLPQFAEHIKNPFAPIPGAEHFDPEPEDPNEPKIEIPKADEDRELTEEEKKEIERLSKKYKFFYADPDLPADMRKPEKIYDYLLRLLPKCDKCGRIGMYQLPKELQEKINKNSNQDKKENKDDHSHGDDPESCDHDHDCSSDNQQPSQDDQGCGHGCSGCGGGYDIFDFGDTLDDHMDSEESPDKMAKRLADAIESTKRMAGHVPANLEDELGQLMAPRVRWQDFIRNKLVKTRQGNGRNDWTKFKTRQLFAGLLTPKRVNNYATFGCLLDTSGSMSREDMAFGVSQLQSIDERSEGFLTCGDAELYWDKTLKLRRMSAEELQKIKPVGRGGTMFANYFSDYEKHIGKCDFLIVITDGFLMDTDIAEMIDPGIPVYWLVTSGHSFNAPFGKVFDLKSH